MNNTVVVTGAVRDMSRSVTVRVHEGDGVRGRAPPAATDEFKLHRDVSFEVLFAQTI